MQKILKLSDTFRVGFQERNDTYSGKLAYVISLEGRENMPSSWEGWRDKNIPYQDFKNEPVNGFVLNRDVGGTHRSYDWNARREKVRVYDPRGFEIEISLENLLLILQECTSVKGKGLEGELLYAWSGNQIVLLPVGCEEHKNAQLHKKLKTKKITKDDMVEGCIYLTKKNKKVMYMGRHPSYEFEHNGNRTYSWRYNYLSTPGKPSMVEKSKKYNVYKYLEPGKYEPDFFNKSGFVFLAERLTDEPYPDYVDNLKEMKELRCYSKTVDLSWDKNIKYLLTEKDDGDYFCVIDDKLCVVTLEHARTYGNGSFSNSLSLHNKKMSDYKTTLCWSVKWNPKKLKADFILCEEDFLRNKSIFNKEDLVPYLVSPKTVYENGNSDTLYYY